MTNHQIQLGPIFDRISTSRLTDPGPTQSQIELLIKSATSAPDHGKLRPWRFTLFEGEARKEFGTILSEALISRMRSKGETPTEGQIEKEKNKLLRAPLVIAVSVSVERNSHIPLVEQISSGAAACQNMLIAATAMGIGSMWRTGEPTYDDTIKESLGLTQTDQIIGWLYFGTPLENVNRERNSEQISHLVRHWVQK